MNKNETPDFIDIETPRVLSHIVRKTASSPERLFVQAERKLGNLDDEFDDWCKQVLDKLKWAEDLLDADPTNKLHWNTVSDLAHEIRGTCANYDHDAIAAVAYSLYKLTSEVMAHANDPRVIKLFELHLSAMQRIRLEGDAEKLGKNHPVAVEIDQTREALFEILG